MKIKYRVMEKNNIKHLERVQIIDNARYMLNGFECIDLTPDQGESLLMQLIDYPRPRKSKKDATPTVATVCAYLSVSNARNYIRLAMLRGWSVEKMALIVHNLEDAKYFLLQDAEKLG